MGGNEAKVIKSTLKNTICVHLFENTEKSNRMFDVERWFVFLRFF